MGVDSLNICLLEDVSGVVSNPLFIYILSNLKAVITTNIFSNSIFIFLYTYYVSMYVYIYI